MTMANELDQSIQAMKERIAVFDRPVDMTDTEWDNWCWGLANHIVRNMAQAEIFNREAK